MLEDLQRTIQLPMPPIKKIKKATVHHCPWKVGSLLAYRIIANKEQLCDHPCYGKYVLLRILDVAKHPLSHVFDTGYYNETMLVGLYNWIGNTIPDPSIVRELSFIPTEKNIANKQFPNLERRQRPHYIQ